MPRTTTTTLAEMLESYNFNSPPPPPPTKAQVELLRALYILEEHLEKHLRTTVYDNEEEDIVEVNGRLALKYLNRPLWEKHNYIFNVAQEKSGFLTYKIYPYKSGKDPFELAIKAFRKHLAGTFEDGYIEETIREIALFIVEAGKYNPALDKERFW